jgi:3-oxoacyl-[acyl-carrier-protein] synthase III
MPVPSAVSFIQKNPGASKSLGFDINGGCAGFTWGSVLLRWAID